MNPHNKCMTKYYNSIQFRITFSFVILIFFVAVLSFSYTYIETKKALLEQTRHELSHVAEIIASQIDGDLHSTIKPGDEGTENYEKIKKQLFSLKGDVSDIVFVYTMRKDEEGAKFVVDAYDEDDFAKIGEIYYEATPEMMEGFSTSSADKEFITDEWGTFLSGYSPIYNSDGEKVGLVGVDMDSALIVEKQKFLGSTIYFVIIMAVLISSLLIYILLGTIIRDIKKMHLIAEQILEGKIEFEMPVIKSRNELYELREAMKEVLAYVDRVEFQSKIAKKNNKKKREAEEKE